jgi:hypothetical protein
VREKVRGFAERVTCPEVQFQYKYESVPESPARRELSILVSIQAGSFG